MTKHTNKYFLTLAPKSFCSACKKEVFMLADFEVNKPAFYICFACKRVYQIGVGEVDSKRVNPCVLRE